MKKISIFLLGLFISALGYSQSLELQAEPKAVSGVPVLEFANVSHDFGEITQGEKVSHTFSFANAGTVPLVISRVQTTCGCTVPKWPSQPVLPGDTQDIAVTFNSAGKMGVQNKIITIHSNASEPVFRLTLKSNVLKKVVEPADSGK